MFVVMLLIAFQQGSTYQTARPAHEVLVPLSWDKESAAAYGYHIQVPQIAVVSKPELLNFVHDLFQGAMRPLEAQSNLDRWYRSRPNNDNEQYCPKTAKQVKVMYQGPPLMKDQYLSGRFWKEPSETLIHMPWHIPIQSRQPEYFKKECVLLYDLVSEPSVGSGFYSGVVCYIPSIRCRALTIADLEHRLLESYTEYLKRMDEEVCMPDGYLLFQKDFPSEAALRNIETSKLSELLNRQLWVQFGY